MRPGRPGLQAHTPAAPSQLQNPAAPVMTKAPPGRPGPKKRASRSQKVRRQASGQTKGIIPMDTLSAFAMGQAHRDKPSRVFDWITAARLIRERQPSRASAGLANDWEYTGGEIYRDGSPVPKEETYTYLASNWATPELDLDGDVQDCWVWKADTDWDSGTYWPAEALAVLRGEAQPDTAGAL